MAYVQEITVSFIYFDFVLVCNMTLSVCGGVSNQGQWA